jgi:putative heme-binding domain-containing protein
VTKQVFGRWSALSRTTRQQLLASAGRHVTSAAALLAEIDKGAVSLIEVDATTRQAVQRMQDREVKAAADKLFASAVDADREQVIGRYKPALALAADRRHGALVFEKNCAVCHQMQGLGKGVGPDLSGIGTQTRESLLMQILDPSRQVLPDFVAYNAETKEGDSYSGFIANESATTVTLRRANEPDITLKRSELSDFRTSGKSLMPDGLEAAIPMQDMADLIEFLRRPDRTLFSELKTSN